MELRNVTKMLVLDFAAKERVMRSIVLIGKVLSSPAECSKQRQATGRWLFRNSTVSAAQKQFRNFPLRSCRTLGVSV